MKKQKINRWMRLIHRDLGYFIFVMVIVYCISGMALNHRHTWNGYYKILSTKEITENANVNNEEVDEEYVLNLLEKYEYKEEYKRFLKRGNNLFIIFKSGILRLNTKTGEGKIELRRKRPVLYQTLFLHGAAKKLWIWFSDIFSIFLIVVTITGLIIVKGKKGFIWRGLIIGFLGIIIPIIVLVLFMK